MLMHATAFQHLLSSSVVDVPLASSLLWTSTIAGASDAQREYPKNGQREKLMPLELALLQTHAHKNRRKKRQKHKYRMAKTYHEAAQLGFMISESRPFGLVFLGRLYYDDGGII